MSQLVFFLEEPSAREMLKGILPRLNLDADVLYVVFEGKQDLEKRLPIRLRAWQRPDSLFVVLRDQDSGDCVAIKKGLKARVEACGRENVLIRIACRELESFYLGDLAAVATALGPAKIAKLQSRAKFRNPDQLGSPSVELKKIAPSYQKISGSRAIAPLLEINNNTSNSFKQLIRGLRALTGNAS